jgi:hypothetical protein
MRHQLCFGVVAVALCGAIGVSPAMADGVVVFDNHAAFTVHNGMQGKFLKSIENFEESSAPAGIKQPFPNPLQNGVPRPSFPNGIDATNLIIQTNITPGASPAALNPSGNERALWVNGAGFLGSNSIKVGCDEFLYGLDASLDLLFTSGDKTAIGLDASTYTGFNAGHTGFVITVYDLSNNVLATVPIGPSTEPGKMFFGIWSPVPIGRVNVYGLFSQPQPFAVDNIEMWVPAPGAGVLLGLGGLLGIRRRR